jgi:hypothetical protein
MDRRPDKGLNVEYIGKKLILFLFSKEEVFKYEEDFSA